MEAERTDDGAEAAPEAVANGEGEPTKNGSYVYMGVEPKIGVPPKWMVYSGKPYFLMDDLGGPPLFLETPIYTINQHGW